MVDEGISTRCANLHLPWFGAKEYWKEKKKGGFPGRVTPGNSGVAIEVNVKMFPSDKTVDQDDSLESIHF